MRATEGERKGERERERKRERERERGGEREILTPTILQFQTMGRGN